MQGKSNKQYEDSSRFAMFGFVGIVVIALALLLGVGEMTGFNDEMGEKIKNDPRPTNHLYNYMHPNHWSGNDTISDELLDSLEVIDPDMMYHREYHGKEGKNGEWGEYVPSDSILEDCSDDFPVKSFADSDEEEYLEYWYTMVDTNSNGVPDDIEVWDSLRQKWILIDDYDQGPCGGDYENRWLESEVTRGVSPDPIQTDEWQMWITGDGDTIWE